MSDPMHPAAAEPPTEVGAWKNLRSFISTCMSNRTPYVGRFWATLVLLGAGSIVGVRLPSPFAGIVGCILVPATALMAASIFRLNMPSALPRPPLKREPHALAAGVFVLVWVVLLLILPPL